VQRMSLGGVLGRFLASLALVVATYNPTGYSLVGWIGSGFPHVQPLQAVIGIVLLGFWLFFVHATWISLGTIGVVLGLAFFAAVIWLVTSWGWLSISDHGALTWVVLLVIACLLTLGVSWASIRRRVSGQAVVEEVRR
jgi:Family of unknown function (DUF6524)